MRFFRSFNARMFLSHLGVALITGDIVVSLLLIVVWFSGQNISLDGYRQNAVGYATLWLLGFPDGEPNDRIIDASPGFALVLAPDNTVVWSRGDTNCRTQAALAECAPELLTVPEVSARFFERDEQQWVEISLPLATTGQRVLTQRGPHYAEASIAYGDTLIYGYGNVLAVQTVATALLSIPVALVLTWLFVRPTSRRIKAVMNTSKRFAEGDLAARVQDSQGDEVGQLAQQFDDMAAALEQNIGALRDLAQRNAELAQEAEQAAIQAERARLSRDLHDAIAQRLFSLSMSTTTLPGIIVEDRERGIQQAKVIAELAERTQLDLRALLTDLRPANVMQRGLSEALQTLCVEWQRVSLIPVDCSLVLSGKHIPSAVEDTVYRITQEALSNITKHARAHRVHISLLEGQRQMILSVSDDGVGFDPTSITGSGRFGLMSMRERASAVGGQLMIESDPERGTTLQVRLPLDRSAEI